MKLFSIRRPTFVLLMTAFVVCRGTLAWADDPLPNAEKAADARNAAVLSQAHAAQMRIVLAQAAIANADNEAIAKGVRFLGDHLVTLRLSGGMDSLIGVEAVPAEEVLRVQLGLAEGQGLAITNVAKDGPAAKAGIQANDVLITIDDKNITDGEAFRKQLHESVDKAVKIGYVRAAGRHVVELTPKNPVADARLTLVDQLVQDASSRYWLGVGLAGADATLRSQLNVPDSEGLVVTSVEAPSPAARGGVMVNDLLLKLDGKALKTIEELSANLLEIGDRSVSLELLRRGKPATLSVTPEKQLQHNLRFHVRTPAVQSLFFAIPEHSGAFSNNTLSGTTAIRAAIDTIGISGLTIVESQNRSRVQAPLAEQVNRLLEQSKQLQTSLETLKAAINEPPATANGDQEPKPSKP